MNINEVSSKTNFDPVKSYIESIIIKDSKVVLVWARNLVFGRVAWWLATCARKPKDPGSYPAASYAQR